MFPPAAAVQQALRFPCSAEQRRFWLLDRIDPGNPALHHAVRWRLEGQVSRADLELAFARIIARHQPLRMFIAEEDGEPQQWIEPYVSFHIPDVDLTTLNDEEASMEADRIAQMEARASFDLSLPPLIRATHLRLRGDVSIVLITVHCVACDSASLAIVAREMSTICTALHAERPSRLPVLPALPISYGDYVTRRAQQPDETQWLDDAYWTEALQDFRHFELQADYPRPPVQTTNAGVVSLLLEPELCTSLEALSSGCDCSPFVTTLTVLLTLLHRYSGETDIAISSLVSDHDQAPVINDIADDIASEIGNVVGVFSNTIMLRHDLRGDPGFAELLLRVRDRHAEALRHAGTPLNRLIELLKPRRDLSRKALFSINYIFQQSLIDNRQHASFRLIEMPPCTLATMVDLNFSMVARAEGWRFSCEYNTDLFDGATIGRLLHHFGNLLRAAVSDPAQSISLMTMLDAAERQHLIVERNATLQEYPQYLTTPQLFEIQVERDPDAIALICAEQSLSYRDLDLAANRLAQELHSRGIGRGSRVAICLDRSPELVVALLAVMKSGGAYVPLDPAYPAPRLAQILEDARPTALLSKLALWERLPPSDAMAILVDVEAGSIARQRETPLDSVPSPDAIAYVIYTSGSTGRPKGVQIQHRALSNLLWAMRNQPGLDDSDTLVAVTTVSFDIAALELFLPLVVGATLVIAQEDDTSDGTALLRLLRRHQATVMQATPVSWQLLLAAGWHGDPPLKMLCGGEAMTRALADQLLEHNGELWNLYGPTETTIWSSALRVMPGAGAVPIGPPIANTRFYVLDAHRQLVASGAPGELYIGGDGVALGYLNLPELNRERFVDDPFRELDDVKLYRTGDRVRMRPGGELEFLGRTDHQIKLRGFRIELGDIEAALRAQPQLADCVAVASSDATGDSVIRAYVVASEPRRQTEEELVASLRIGLRAVLPMYMCPAVIVVLEALPRMPNGKIDRAALPVPSPLADKLHQPLPGSSQLQHRLTQIWSAVLGSADVDIDANFFEIGGHSLLAVRLLARIEAEFGRKLSLATLFKHPSLAEQLKLLEQGDPRSFDFRQVLKLQANGSRPPLIAINNTGIYYPLSRHLGNDQPFTSLQLFDPSLPHAALPQTLEDIAAGYAQLIRRVQRSGPYALLGWCVAGSLAFEVARQLTAAGQSVSQLVLFDTLAPGHLRRLPWYRALLTEYSYRWKLIAADWARTRVNERWFATFIANRLIVKKLMRWLMPELPAIRSEVPVAGQPLSPEQYDQWLLHYLEAAADRYEPKPYSGSLLLFRSSAEPAGRFLDPRMGWGAFAAGGVEVVVIDGDHFSIFQEPSVSLMARRIAADIDQAPLPVSP